MQDALAILIVALAVAFLARRGWYRLVHRSRGICGSCGSCPSVMNKTQPVVTIDQLKIPR